MCAYYSQEGRTMKINYHKQGLYYKHRQYCGENTRQNGSGIYQSFSHLKKAFDCIKDNY